MLQKRSRKGPFFVIMYHIVPRAEPPANPTRIREVDE
jgi:hypothetical protein